MIWDENTEAVGMLRRAYEYIEKRRPYETWTLAILNERRYDLLDEIEAVNRNRRIN